MTDRVRKKKSKNQDELSVLIELLQEYTEKFRNVTADEAVSMRGPATELARYTSQLIEHAELEMLAKLELRLRLAEFENATNAAMQQRGE
ncbi:MAG: hypothetical protein ACFCD0_13420 [Gemmataceae bacterium]